MNDEPPGLLDEVQIEDIFSLATDAETRTALREMFREFYAEAELQLARLDPAADPAALARQLHQLRGMMANYGFAGCSALLASWETSPVSSGPVGRRAEIGQVLVASRSALLRRYEWLR